MTSKTFWIVSCLVIISLLGLYVYQINAETSERYLVQECQKKIGDISRENEVLEINSVQAGSLENISKIVENLEFEKADKISYIQVLNAQVVKR